MSRPVSGRQQPRGVAPQTLNSFGASTIGGGRASNTDEGCSLCCTSTWEYLKLGGFQNQGCPNEFFKHRAFILFFMLIIGAGFVLLGYMFPLVFYYRSCYAPGFPFMTTNKALCVRELSRFTHVNLNLEGCKVLFQPLSAFPDLAGDVTGTHLRGRLFKDSAITFETDCNDNDNDRTDCTLTVQNRYPGPPDPTDALYEEWKVYKSLYKLPSDHFDLTSDSLFNECSLKIFVPEEADSTAPSFTINMLGERPGAVVSVPNLPLPELHITDKGAPAYVGISGSIIHKPLSFNAARGALNVYHGAVIKPGVSLLVNTQVAPVQIDLDGVDQAVSVTWLGDPIVSLSSVALTKGNGTATLGLSTAALSQANMPTIIINATIGSTHSHRQELLGNRPGVSVVVSPHSSVDDDDDDADDNDVSVAEQDFALISAFDPTTADKPTFSATDSLLLNSTKSFEFALISVRGAGSVSEGFFFFSKRQLNVLVSPPLLSAMSFGILAPSFTYVNVTMQPGLTPVPGETEMGRLSRIYSVLAAEMGELEEGASIGFTDYGMLPIMFTPRESNGQFSAERSSIMGVKRELVALVGLALILPLLSGIAVAIFGGLALRQKYRAERMKLFGSTLEALRIRDLAPYLLENPEAFDESLHFLGEKLTPMQESHAAMAQSGSGDRCNKKKRSQINAKVNATFPKPTGNSGTTPTLTSRSAKPSHGPSKPYKPHCTLKGFQVHKYGLGTTCFALWCPWAKSAPPPATVDDDNNNVVDCTVECACVRTLSLPSGGTVTVKGRGALSKAAADTNHHEHNGKSIDDERIHCSCACKHGPGCDGASDHCGGWYVLDPTRLNKLCPHVIFVLVREAAESWRMILEDTTSPTFFIDLSLVAKGLHQALLLRNGVDTVETRRLTGANPPDPWGVIKRMFATVPDGISSSGDKYGMMVSPVASRGGAGGAGGRNDDGDDDDSDMDYDYDDDDDSGAPSLAPNIPVSDLLEAHKPTGRLRLLTPLLHILSFFVSCGPVLCFTCYGAYTYFWYYNELPQYAFVAFGIFMVFATLGLINLVLVYGDFPFLIYGSKPTIFNCLWPIRNTRSCLFSPGLGAVRKFVAYLLNVMLAIVALMDIAIVIVVALWVVLGVIVKPEKAVPYLCGLVVLGGNVQSLWKKLVDFKDSILATVMKKVQDLLQEQMKPIQDLIRKDLIAHMRRGGAAVGDEFVKKFHIISEDLPDLSHMSAPLLDEKAMLHALGSVWLSLLSEFGLTVRNILINVSVSTIVMSLFLGFIYIGFAVFTEPGATAAAINSLMTIGVGVGVNKKSASKGTGSSGTPNASGAGGVQLGSVGMLVAGKLFAKVQQEILAPKHRGVLIDLYSELFRASRHATSGSRGLARGMAQQVVAASGVADGVVEHASDLATGGGDMVMAAASGVTSNVNRAVGDIEQTMSPATLQGSMNAVEVMGPREAQILQTLLSPQPASSPSGFSPQSATVIPSIGSGTSIRANQFGTVWPSSGARAGNAAGNVWPSSGAGTVWPSSGAGNAAGFF